MLCYCSLCSSVVCGKFCRWIHPKGRKEERKKQKQWTFLGRIRARKVLMIVKQSMCAMKQKSLEVWSWEHLLLRLVKNWNVIGFTFCSPIPDCGAASGVGRWISCKFYLNLTWYLHLFVTFQSYMKVWGIFLSQITWVIILFVDR